MSSIETSIPLIENLPIGSQSELGQRNKSNIKTRKALVVDDDVRSVELINLLLMTYGYDVTVCFNGEACLEHLAESRYEVLILDWMLPDLKGEDILFKLNKACLEHIYSYGIDFLTAKQRYRKGLRNRSEMKIITHSNLKINQIKLPEYCQLKVVGHLCKSDGYTSNTRVFNDLIRC